VYLVIFFSTYCTVRRFKYTYVSGTISVSIVRILIAVTTQLSEI